MSEYKQQNPSKLFFSCDKLFRDMDALMFHATKSGHENFSESTEVCFTVAIKSLETFDFLE